MWVISLRRMRDFWETHPEAERPLRGGVKTALHASWPHLAGVRKAFPHADQVVVGSGSVMTVFNIAGNKYRLVVRIEYEGHKIYIKQIMTHAEYSKDHWKKSL
jgi:mRNA interferase HigB